MAHSNPKPKAFGKTVSFTESRFHKKIEKKYPELKGKYTQKQYRDELNAFWEKCGDILINQPNGIVLDGLGYFAFPVFSIRSRFPKTNITTFSIGGEIPYPQFYGKVFNNHFLVDFSYEMNRSLKSKWVKLVRSGFKYKFHYKHLKKLIGDGKKYIHSHK